MKTIEVTGWTDAEGVLHATIPTGQPHSQAKLTVVLEQLEGEAAKQRAWEAWIDKTYGSLAHDRIERPEW